MLMAGDSSNFWSFDNTSAADDDFDGLSIDLDSLMDILGEGPDSLQNRPEDSSLQIMPHGESASDFGVNEHSMLRIGLPESEGAPSVGVEVPGSVIFFPSYNSEASDSRTGGSDGSFESGGNSAMFECAKLEPLAKIGSPVHSCSGSLTEWMSPVRGNGASCADRDGVCQNASSYIRDDIKEYQFEIPNCSATSSFAAGDAEFQFRRLGGSTCSNYLSDNQWMENSDINHRTYFDSGEDSFKTSGAPGMEGTYIMDLGPSFQSVSYTQSSLCEFPDILYATGDQYSPMPYCTTDDSFYFGPSNLPENIGLHSMLNNDEVMVNIKDEGEELPTQNAFLNDARIFEAKGGDIAAGTVSAALMASKSGMGLNANCDGRNLILPTSGDSSDKTGSRLTVDKASIKFLPRTLSNMPSKKQEVCIKNEKNDEQISSQGTACRSFEAMDDVVNRKSSAFTDGLYTKKGSRQSLSGILTSISSKKHVVAKGEKEDVFLESKRSRNSLDNIDETCKILTPISDNRCLDIKAPKQPCLQPSTIIRKQLGCPMDEKESKLTQSKSTNSLLSKVCHQSVKNNAWVHRSQIDDDSDICILEDMNEPARQNLSTVNGKPAVTEICSSFNDPHPPNHSGAGGVRLKTNDERFIFRVALQDLSQPKSESTPPEGVLAVPLLRHQRIALSWMVQMETTSVLCSGGILADDQGLGKTISTIALILKERSPSSSVCTIGTKKSETETLNLDEDDDSVSELDGSKQDAESCQVMENGGSTRGKNTSPQAKGRPAAGTLVVCPTSVLRQWYEELRNKVTSKANLSVLLYHGSNRTKDPFELAKYDVVLTTYSIVSMEVPKQPLVDDDDDEPGKRNNVPPMGLPSSKKRKYPPSSDKGSLKGKKGMDSELFESVARPLARVGWFRVVLDEAQSIKNHRTQVARACWGLRAKRRWCLSGTPIQNAVDDLYSYFRFLRYDPYAVYKKFCSTIKVPIHRNPANGYRKLQAVLKTIMLRRTKGTLLDGEPIINLPPKTIELKKVDFTLEEREFYCRLEADSRAQFAEYAAAGTVKQNYVNILLMLLRLRQACDHPLLVRGCGASSVWRSSVETAKKLSREKQICLLNCLEASLAICGICNDPPEDAVVTSCEHVFCNQCICEHLTGDDNQCPTANCKARLSASSVFSSTTLRSSLSDQPGQESSLDCSGSGSVLAETLEPCSSGGSFDSSKIKAALEVLQSLSRPRDFSTSRTSSLISSIDGSACCPENSSHPLSEELHMHVNRNLDSDGGSNDLVSVVGEKAIVFSQWTRMLDLLEACLKNSSIQYRRLDGTMSVVARDKAVKDFNTLPEVSVMIMSLKAASLGLNMVAACHVLLLDLWWNPTTEDQAIDRAHRIGQTRPVTVLRLTVKDTVEDRILALQQKKREMVSSAFGEDETGSRQTRLTVEDLKYLFMA